MILLHGTGGQTVLLDPVAIARAVRHPDDTQNPVTWVSTGSDAHDIVHETPEQIARLRCVWRMRLYSYEDDWKRIIYVMLTPEDTVHFELLKQEGEA